MSYPEWVDPRPWAARAAAATPAAVERALESDNPGPAEMAVLLSPAAAPFIEPMAARAQALTRSHFGRTIALYAPLYLSNFCSNGCVYCGFAADRHHPRQRLEPDQIDAELAAIHALGFEDVLLLTGERSRRANYEYLRDAVARAARVFHAVAVESFGMSAEEYRGLAEAGCTSITVYQETYDPDLYDRLHRWGPKRFYANRLEAPGRALEAGMRTVGLGALLGLADPVLDMVSLFLHVSKLRREHWRGGVAVSFPRICPEAGGYQPAYPVGEALLARIIFAFRICLPDVPLVLSTRESRRFRDGIAGVGINRMSAGSRTTVGGYGGGTTTSGQFDIRDGRGVPAFCAALRRKGLEPVFKNWDSVFQGV